MPIGGIGTAFGVYLVEELQVEHTVPFCFVIMCVHAFIPCSSSPIDVASWLTYLLLHDNIPQTAVYAAKFKPSFVLRVELTHIYPASIQPVLSPRQRASGSSSSVSMMAKPVQLPTEDSFVAFEEAVLKRELPVMVYFHAM